METQSFKVYEWTIENFSYWNQLVHGECIRSIDFALPNTSSFYLILYPQHKIGSDDVQVTVRIVAGSNDLKAGGNLSFFDSEGCLCTKRVKSESRPVDVASGLKFEEVTARIKNNGDLIILKVYFLSATKGFRITGSTTLDLLERSVRLDSESIERMKYGFTKNISIIHFSKKNYLDELLLKVVRNKETVEFVLELWTKSVKAVSVKSLWRLQSSDKTILRNEEKKYIFGDCTYWIFSNCAVEELTNVNMLLKMKISTGDIFHEKQQISEETPTVAKKTVCFFDEKKITFNKTVDSVAQIPKDLMCLFKDQKLVDITIKCNDVSISAHRAVLAARSPVFETMMLSSDMQEAASGHVEITDIDPSILALFVTFLYKGAVGEEDMQGKNALHLYDAADKYQVPSLKMECTDFLCSKVSVSNVCDILCLGQRHQDQFLTSAARDFLLENFKKVMNSEEWKLFVKKEPTLAAETLKTLY